MKITKTDTIISTSNNGYLGKVSKKVNEINDMTIAPLLFDILERVPQALVEGNLVPLEGYKVLLADHRQRLDLPEDERLVPLHVPKTGYEVIPNRAIWEALKTSLAGVGAKVVSAMTIEGGKKFCVSAEIGDPNWSIGGDKCAAFLHFLSSHNGTLAMNAFDLGYRFSCDNQWKMGMKKSEHLFKVYHTKNAGLAMSGMGDLLNQVLQNRILWTEALENLQRIKVNAKSAMEITAGHLLGQTSKSPEKFSTRSMNSATEIARLFSHGQGNKGETMYDLFNGATEYWSSGEGTGKGRGNPSERMYRSVYGRASDNKESFAAMLMGDTDRVKELGREALHAYSLN